MKHRQSRIHAWLLLALAVGMFGFAFALVPLYDVFCEVTGLNGKTSPTAAVLRNDIVPAERTVRIEFLARVARGTPWEFRPLTPAVTVRPGELQQTAFYVRNHSANAITAQAVPSVSPGEAAQYLKKLECFCFEQQQLPAGGDAEIGVRFLVDSALPPEITELTLSYTMYVVQDDEQLALRN